MLLLPVVLARDTIVECVFEARFTGAHPGIAELLPGIVFGRFPGRFKNVATLPLGHMPKLMRDQNAQFRYLPTAALEGPNVRMLFGEHSVAVSFAKPYAGWAKVKPLIIECMNTVFDTNLVGRPERYALKFVNLLKEGHDAFDLNQTNVQINLGGFVSRPQSSTFVRSEIDLNGCVNLVDIVTGAKVNLPGTGEETGVALSVDTVSSAVGPDARAELPQVLETLHETEKEVFFGLLTAPTIEKLGPRYPSKH